MIRAIQHNCDGSYEGTIAALDMEFQRKVDIVCLQEPSREWGGVGISHLAYEKTKRNRV